MALLQDGLGLVLVLVLVLELELVLCLGPSFQSVVEYRGPCGSAASFLVAELPVCLHPSLGLCGFRWSVLGEGLAAVPVILRPFIVVAIVVAIVLHTRYLL